MKAVVRGRSTSRKHDVPSSSSAPLPSSSSPPTTIELCGVPIHFPFKPYQCQRDYMSKVLEALHRSENALLESPTGTGKTLCLLCSTLAWQREQARLLPENASQLSAAATATTTTATTTTSNKVPTIIYASRTHSQLSQVVRELRNTRYRPKHAVLGSRDQMCVHPKVSASQDVNFACNKLAKERKCRYRNQLEGFSAPITDEASSKHQPVMDMEDLVAMGKQRKVCPFYYTRAAVADAELVLIPYNYLFDKDARDSTLAQVQWNKSVIIFDEAHNLEGFASEAASFDLTNMDIAGCITEVTRAINYGQANPEVAERVNPENLTKIKAILLSLEEYLVQHKNTTNQSAFAGEYIFEIFGKGASITHANHHLFLQEVQKVSDMIMDVAGKSTPKLNHICTCIKLAFGESTEGRCLAKARAYRVHLENNVLSYWCFAPSLAMQELASLGVGSILVTSGTLSPLPSYGMELGLRFPQRLENPHIIQDQQIHVRVIGKGVSGKLLSSTYERRESEEYIAELGNSLVSLARIIPGGMLIFFPSYGVMEKCIERWGGPTSRSSNRFQNNNKNRFFAARGRQSSKSNRYSFPHAPNYYASSEQQSTPWKRLLAQKAVVVEPKSTSDLSNAISEFHKFLGTHKSSGCVLMGVCRGKISEGIDFSDDMCRAVVITGLPFAPYLDPKVKLKREYLDGLRAEQSNRGVGGFGSGDNKHTAPMTISGAEWYSQQAHRAVNQAIGRVIRNRSDYGAVLLLDSRFGEGRNQIGLSKWLRPHVQNDEGFGRAIGGLVSFYKEAKRQASEQKRLNAPPERSMVLEYEQETKMEEKAVDDTMTNIAIIQTHAADASSHGTDVSQGEQKKASNDTSLMDTDKSFFEGYVKPDRVLARIDLKKRREAKHDNGGAIASDLQSQDSSDFAPTSLKDLYSTTTTASSDRKTLSKGSGKNPASAWANLDNPKSPSRQRQQKRFDSGDHSKALKDVPLKKSKASASDFFNKARSLLDSADFAGIRKILITMKAHGDIKDVRSYMRSACDLVDILVRYDRAGVDKRTSSGLLELLSPLLPKVHREDIMKYAMKRRFEESNFCRDCRKLLSSEKFDALRSVMPVLMHNPQQGSSQTISKAYVRDAEKVICVLMEQDAMFSGKNNQLSLMDQFFRLIPSGTVSAVQALAHQLKATQNIRRIKKVETYLTGERSLETARFQKAQAPFQKAPSKKDSGVELTHEQLQEQREMEAAMLHASEVLRGKRERVAQQMMQAKEKKRRQGNAYQSNKRRFTGKGPIPSFKPLPSLPARKSRTASCSLHKDNKENSRQSLTPDKLDPIDKCLRQVESDAYYVDANSRAPAEIAKRIKSNVPSGFVCTVCDKHPKQPFMANCGHHACLECWLQWLGKSTTCPVCRAPTEKNSLAKMVFQTKPGEDAPTMTQLCASVEESGDSSSEEELELVAVPK